LASGCEAIDVLLRLAFLANQKGGCRMKTRHLIALTMIAFVALAACNFSYSTATISDAKMGKGVNDKMEVQNPTTTFDGTESAIHCVAYLSYAPADTKVKAEWIAVKVEGQKPDNRIAETTIEAGGDKNAIDFTLTPPSGGLPSGQYRVDLYINPQPNAAAAPAKTVSFTVQNSSSSAMPTGGTSPDTGTVEISSAVLSTDENGANPTTVFPVGTKRIYCYVRLEGVSDGAKINARWVAAQAEGRTNYEIRQSSLDLNSGMNVAKFYLEVPDGFPAGNYYVELRVGASAEPEQTLQFQVE
jgi:hypothetical protein